MRVAVFSSAVDAKDGYGTITKELTAHLAAAGVDLTLFLPRSQAGAAAALSPPFPVRCVLPEYVYRVFERGASGHLRTVALQRFDLVHSLFAFPYCVLAARSAKRAGLPFLMGAQGTHGVRPLTMYPERWLLRWSYARAERIVVPSEFTREKICEYAGRRYPIDVIHNGVDFGRFRKEVDVSDLRERFRGKQILLTVGGLWGRKGHDLVLRALPMILAKRRDVVYLVVGEGGGRDNLEALARSLGVAPNVAFVGPKYGDDLVRYFHACDVYVHTPRVTGLKFEGFGIVYLEAGACGKPVVATDAGGIRDAVLDGKTGIVVPDGDVAGIAGAVLRLLREPAEMLRLGENGREYARQNDWEIVAGRYASLYHDIHAAHAHYRRGGVHRGEYRAALPPEGMGG